MRKDTSFTNRKLTRAEFSDKYWRHGRLVDQYHTMTIEDGRDEHEQLIINNLRALYNLTKMLSQRIRQTSTEDERRMVRKIKRMAILIGCSMAVNIAALIVIALLWYQL